MKKNWKRALSLLMATALIAGVLAGCGGSTQADTTQQASSSGTESDDESFPAMNIQLYHVNPTSDDDQYNKFATLFTEKVTAATDGAVTFDIIGNTNENDILTGFGLGTHELAIVTNGTYAAVYGPSNIAEMPFFFKDNQTAWDFLDGDVMKEVTDGLYDEMGYKVLGWAEGGFRNILSQKPIREPSDLTGMKIRVPEFDTFMATFKQLGANPTPMAFSEVFTATQQHVIDGLELPVASAYTGSYYEVCDYYDLTGHFYNSITMSCSSSFWESLTPQLQEIFSAAAVEAGQEQRQWLQEASETMLGEMEDAGCEIVRDVDVAAFQEAVTPVYEMYRDSIGSDLLDRALEAVK
jgi:tripartite ATP-independent transporter DctP family solute receptor